MFDTSLSLLERLQTQPAESDWQLLVDLYDPLIRAWLRRDPSLGDEADDTTQEVMKVLLRELPRFRHERPGSFRSWLRAITVHRLKAFWRQRQRRPRALGQTASGSNLLELEDPASELSRQWDRDHDEHVVERLLKLIEPEFTAPTWQAFRRVAVEGARPAQAATELGVSVNAVLLAKSRVLKRLRDAGRGLID